MDYIPDNYDQFLILESKRPGVVEDWELDYEEKEEEEDE